MVSIDDAWSKYQLAEQALKSYDYANCVFNSQASIELSIKSLLDGLQIKYEMEHDVSDRLDEVPKKIKLEEYEIPDLSKLKAYSKLWVGVRNLTEYGDQRLNIAARSIFSEHEAKLALDHCSTTYHKCNHWLNKPRLFDTT